MNTLPFGDSGDGEPLKLNVYDLTRMNGVIYWLGIGAHHSGVEAYGMEFAFGAHDYPSSGVFEVKPRQCPGFRFRKSIPIGIVWMGAEKFRDFIEEIVDEYTGDSYHLLFKNCNHFSDDICMRLVSSCIPGWINRLSRLGSFANCFISNSLQSNCMHSLEYKYDDDDHTEISSRTFCRLTSTLATVLPKKRHLFLSSTFLQSTWVVILSRDFRDLSFSEETPREL